MRKFSHLLLLAPLLIPARIYAACIGTPPNEVPYPIHTVYKNMPFSRGEVLTLSVSYLGLNAGYLEFRVLEPGFFRNQWLMGFDALVITGDWYEKFFKAHDEGIAYLHPDSFSPSHFRLTQNHVPLVGKRYTEDKLLNFDFVNCVVTEEYRDETNKVKKSVKAELDPDATDILGALYKLRTVDFIKNSEARIKVYTSEKNWWLTATKEDLVHLTVPVGKFDAVRLKLQTYIGKELQQKGRVLVWIAIREPSRPILKIEADIKIGSFVAVLSKITKGKL